LGVGGGTKIDFSKKSAANANEAFAKMFNLSSQQSIQGASEVDINLLVPFKDHPFRLYTGEKLKRMVESIKENGVIESIIVRKKEDGTHEILAGHNRVNASKLAGLLKISADIRENISDAVAKIIVTETNFLRRDFDDMLPSELAKSLKMQLDALKELKRNPEFINAIESDSNADGRGDESEGVQVAHPGKSREIVGKNNKMSPDNVRRYIRLNYLNEGLLNMVDDGNIKLVPAVSLSYLTEEEQNILLSILKSNDYRIDIKRAEKLKERSGKLTEDDILAIASGEFFEKKKKAKVTAITLKPKVISKYFTAYATQTEIASVIDTALEEYFERRRQLTEDTEKENSEEVKEHEEN
jgi:ParB family chromosome partitioning protein